MPPAPDAEANVCPTVYCSARERAEMADAAPEPLVVAYCREDDAVGKHEVTPSLSIMPPVVSLSLKVKPEMATVIPDST